MEYCTTLAFVLKQEPVKEQDRNYTFYTQKFGKIILLAPGIRKINAKLSGHLEIPSLVAIQFTISKKPRLVSALEKCSFSNIKQRKKSLLIAFLIVDLVNKLSIENQVEPEVWKLLYDVFYFLEENFNRFPEIADFLWLYFNAHFLEILGLFPFLEGCVECGQAINNKYFSFQKKGIVCAKHSQKQDWPISALQKRLLNLLFNSSLRQFSNRSEVNEILKEKKYLKRFLDEFTLVIKSDIINS